MAGLPRIRATRSRRSARTDRERVVEGKRGDLGGRRIIKKKKNQPTLEGLYSHKVEVEQLNSDFDKEAHHDHNQIRPTLSTLIETLVAQYALIKVIAFSSH